MNKVITIHLRGKAYQIEETGYNHLRNYLDQASQKLVNDPDKDEIIADLEQAIAEKCGVYMNTHKNIITSTEIEEIIKEMGPVDNTETSKEQSAEAKTETTSPKRLYRIREGSMIAGVCNGLAAYLNWDVTIVRIIFIALTLLTGGGWILAYIIMALVVPQAESPQQKAEAFGTIPVTAQKLIDQARQSYQNFTKPEDWKKWKYQMKSEAQKWKYKWKAEKYDHYYNQYKRPGVMQELVGNIIALVWLFVIFFGLWYLYHHVGPVREFMDMLAIAWHRLMDIIVMKLGN